jgi:hypothetical protein
MKTKRNALVTALATLPVRFYWGADAPMLGMIRRFARQVAERFQPEKNILFGSST